MVLCFLHSPPGDSASPSSTLLNTCPQGRALQPPGSCCPFPALRTSRPRTKLILPSSLQHFLQQLLERKHGQLRDAPNPPLQDLKQATGPGPLTYCVLMDGQAMPCSAGSPFPEKQLSKQRGLRPRRGEVLPKPSD